jgi:uncharacterized protein YkwD
MISSASSITTFLLLTTLSLSIGAPICNLCYDGQPPSKPSVSVALLKQNAPIEGQYIYMCSSLWSFGRQGLIPEDKCAPLASSLQVPCGCTKPTDSSNTNANASSSGMQSTYSASSSSSCSTPTDPTINSLWTLTNIERNKYNFASLKYNNELAKAAQYHAGNMAKYDFFNHTGYFGDTPETRIKTITVYDYANYGENIAWKSPNNSPSWVVQAWMDSPGHRENLLNPIFVDVGFGYAVDANKSIHYYVQVFGRPKAGSQVMPAPSSMQASVPVPTAGSPQVAPYDLKGSVVANQLAWEAERAKVQAAAQNSPSTTNFRGSVVANQLAWEAERDKTNEATNFKGSVVANQLAWEAAQAEKQKENSSKKNLRG